MLKFRSTAWKTALAPLAGVAIAMLAAPGIADACACGCGIFDVGDPSVIPQTSDSGLSVFLSYDSMNQDRNHEQDHAANPDDNSDKRIDNSFYTIGANAMIDHTWIVMAELPLVHRRFTTTGADLQGNPVIETVPLTDIGDMLVNLTYTGFSSDMSTGIGLGLKLPTGRSTSPTDRYGGLPYDRDSLPGTGSIDLQVDGFHVGHRGPVYWFAQAQYRFAVATRDDYRPGNELDGALGVSYDLPTRGMRVSPVLQLLGSVRAHDTGGEADPLNSGYRRLLIAPGARVQLTRKLSIYGDVELPIAQYVNAARSVAIEGTSGQLVAPALFKLQVNYGF